MNSNKGFTLIELLVVISIIGVLSSIVLTGLTEARERARNSATLAQMSQYLRAIQFMATDTGSYPYPGHTNLRCLGDGSGSTCWGGAFSEDTQLQDAFSGYYDALPVPSATLEWSSYGPIDNYLYWCRDEDDGDCVWYRAYWVLAGEHTADSCGPGVTGVSYVSLTDSTLCYRDGQL